MLCVLICFRLALLSFNSLQKCLLYLYSLRSTGRLKTWSSVHSVSKEAIAWHLHLKLWESESLQICQICTIYLCTVLILLHKRPLLYQKQKNLTPTTPAQQGPEWAPILSWRGIPGRCGISKLRISSNIRRAIRAIWVQNRVIDKSVCLSVTSRAWRGPLLTGRPDTAI